MSTNRGASSLGAPSRPPRRLAALLLLNALPMMALAAAETRVLPLQHRPASELAELLTPQFAGRAVLTPAGDRLLVRAETAVQAEVARLVAELDRAPRQVVIRLSTEGGQAESGGTRHYSSQRGGEWQVRALEGRPAQIMLSQLLPVPVQRWVLRAPGVVARGTQLDWLELGSGFTAVVTLVGREAELAILPQQQGAQAGRIYSTRAASTVRVPLGSWALLAEAGMSEQPGRYGSSSLSRTQLWVRVDAL